MDTDNQLRLLKYQVNKIRFDLNETYDFKTIKKINIKPDFSRRLKKIDDDKFAVELSVAIIGKDEELPFSIEIAVTGVFALKGFEQPARHLVARTQAVIILFPYLRSLLTLVTANTNLPPYILPVMNIAKMFEDREKELRQTKTTTVN
ncbi:MAG: protein-export chaperone SecB [Acholeplasmataceae bacterium]|nr:protein-export chaperone SecB [Acholeplasmataceae bacterium]